jgi:hypothetical protein
MRMDGTRLEDTAWLASGHFMHYYGDKYLYNQSLMRIISIMLTYVDGWKT